MSATPDISIPELGGGFHIGKLHITRSAIMVTISRLTFIGIILAIWQVGAGGPTSLLPSNVIGRPSAVLSTLWYLVHTGKLFPAWGQTMEHFAIGILIAAPIGIAMGIVTSVKVSRWVFEPIFTILYSIPKVALISIYILVLGVGPKSHVALVLSAAIFVFYYSTEQAFRELDMDKMTALKLMGANRFKIAYSFTLPSAIPALFAATRIAIPLAFTTEIFAELRIPTSEGLGVLLSNYEEFINGPGLMAIFLFVIAVAYILDIIAANLLARYTQSIGAGVQL